MPIFDLVFSDNVDSQSSPSSNKFLQLSRLKVLGDVAQGASMHHIGEEAEENVFNFLFSVLLIVGLIKGVVDYMAFLDCGYVLLFTRGASQLTQRLTCLLRMICSHNRLLLVLQTFFKQFGVYSLNKGIYKGKKLANMGSTKVNVLTLFCSQSI